MTHEPLNAVHFLKCFGFFNVLFHFIKETGSLNDVILVLFVKVVSHFILRRQLGSAILAYLAKDGKEIVPCLARQVGYDSIRDVLV